MPKQKSGIKKPAERTRVVDGLTSIVNKREKHGIEVIKTRQNKLYHKITGRTLTPGTDVRVSRYGTLVQVNAPDVTKGAALALHGMTLEGVDRINVTQDNSKSLKAYRGLFISEVTMGLPGKADQVVKGNEIDLNLDFIDLINGTSSLARKIRSVSGAMPRDLARGTKQDFLECLYYLEHPEELDEVEEPSGEPGTETSDETDHETGVETGDSELESDHETESETGETGGETPSETGSETGSETPATDRTESGERKDPLTDWIERAGDSMEDRSGGWKEGGGGGAAGASSYELSKPKHVADSNVLGQKPHHWVVIKDRPQFKVNLHRHAQGVLNEQESFRTSRLDGVGLVTDETWEASIGNMRVFERPSINSAKLIIAVDMSGSMGCWCGRYDTYRRHGRGRSTFQLESGALAMQVQAALAIKFPDAYTFGFSMGRMPRQDIVDTYSANVMWEMKAGNRPFCNHGHGSNDIEDATYREKAMAKTGFTPVTTSYASEAAVIKEAATAWSEKYWHGMDKMWCMPEIALGNGNPDCAALQYMASILKGQFENAFAVIISDGAPAGITFNPPPGVLANRVMCTETSGLRINIGQHTKNVSHAMHQAGMKFQSILINTYDGGYYPSEIVTHINGVNDIPKLANVMSALQDQMS